MSHVQLQFSTSVDSWANRASIVIRWLNHSPFSHVDFVLPDGNLLGASDNPQAPIFEGNSKGVAIRPPNYQPFGRKHIMTLETDKADQIYNKAMTQLGKPFDNQAIFRFLSIHWPGVDEWRDPDAWFCMELVLWCLEDLFWPFRLPWPKNRASPTDGFLALCTDPRFINKETFWNE